ncbi:hypothetical protein [Streptomyces europaeiscabiei]|uniref:hypothetical protein n=1 Tax=Streptomyces europaeiscabiei TaxID=146819 RepID=UPI0029B65C6D|nr:hypothetical protein [Streptomyces europaeiscabiei]MDX3611294.1 hypothetical protein [Streptomyces europaeiscabiei]
MSAGIAARRAARLSAYQWSGLVVGMLAAALVLPSLLAAVPQLMEGSKWYWRTTSVLRTWHRRRRDQLRWQWSRRREHVERDIRLRRREWRYGTPADQAEATIRVDRLAETLAARYPTDNALIRASAVGNVLSAARQQVADVYALDVLLTWPRLYPVLDRQLHRTANWQRGALDAALSAWAFAMLVLCAVLPISLVWSPYDAVAWGAPATVAVAARLASVRAALRYATTVRVAFDLHRFDLYEALHLPAPGDLAEEQETNRTLSRQWHPYGAVRAGHPAHTAVGRNGIPVSYDRLEEADLETTGDTEDGLVLAEGPASSAGPGAIAGKTEPASRDSLDDDYDEREENELSQLASMARVGTSLAAGGTVAAGALGSIAMPQVGVASLTAAAVGAATTAVAQWLAYRKGAQQSAPPDAEIASPLPLDYAHPTHSPVSVQISDGGLRTAPEPATPVAFRGSVAVTLEGAADVALIDDEPEWRLRSGEPASVVVLLGLGREYQSDPRAMLAERPGMADEMLVVAGQPAGVVELDVLLDAPFLTVTPDRHSVRHDRANGGRPVLFRRTSVLMGGEAGTYDVRVAVYASGRLVQALPVTVVVEDTGAAATTGPDDADAWEPRA